MQANYTLHDDPLSLNRIRSVLIRLEETIIFGLIERAQFAHNPKIYQKGVFKELRDSGFEGSWLDWFLKETESFHAKARRYTGPDEYPFTKASELPKPILAPFKFPRILWNNDINVNPSIYSFYVHATVPRITRQATLDLAKLRRAQGVSGDAEYEDDGNYGSTATIDIEVLQAISKRIHYGKFVSESKFQSDPAAFVPHIQKKNREALENLITNEKVEKSLIERLVKKANTYGRDPGLPESSAEEKSTMKIDVVAVRDLYLNHIIPLTKEVEVDYLLQRLQGLTDADVEKLTNPQANGGKGQ